MLPLPVGLAILIFIYTTPNYMHLLDDLYGYPIGTETPESLSHLLNDLNRELPGIFLTHRLSDLENVTHQRIVDLLGADGLALSLYYASLTNFTCG